MKQKTPLSAYLPTSDYEVVTTLYPDGYRPPRIDPDPDEITDLTNEQPHSYYPFDDLNWYETNPGEHHDGHLAMFLQSRPVAKRAPRKPLLKGAHIDPTDLNQDPLREMQRREADLLAQKNQREVELKRDYEIRLAELDLEYKTKDRELEQEKLTLERRLIYERQREIDIESQQASLGSKGQTPLPSKPGQPQAKPEAPQTSTPVQPQAKTETPQPSTPGQQQPKPEAPQPRTAG